MRSVQQLPDGQEMSVFFRQGQCIEDKGLDQDAGTIRPMRVAVVGDNQRIGDLPCVVLDVLACRIDFIERVEATRRHSAFVEGVQNDNLLALLPTSTDCDAGKFAFGVDGKNRPVI